MGDAAYFHLEFRMNGQFKFVYALCSVQCAQLYLKLHLVKILKCLLYQHCNCLLESVDCETWAKKAHW